MSWELLLFTSILIYSICVIFQKITLSGDAKNPISFSILFQIFVGLLIFFYSLGRNLISIPHLFPILPSLLLMILFWVFNNTFLYKAMQLSDASKFSIIYSTRVFFTILASSLLLQQSLTKQEYVGTLLIVAGILISCIQSRKIQFKKQDMFSVLAAIAFGLAISNDKYLLEYFNPYTYASMVFLLPGAILWIIFPGSTKGMRTYFEKNNLIKLLLSSILMATSIILAYVSLKLSTNSSIYASISIFSTAIIVMLSVIVLKERENLLQKVIGTGVCFLGLILVVNHL